MRFDKKAVLHIPLSNYAFALNEHDLVIRLRTGKNNVSSVYLCFGDTACRSCEVKISEVKMHEVFNDDSFSYFEVTLKDVTPRIVYYFKINDLENNEHYYYADNFYDFVSVNRNDLYKFPYLRREDATNPSSWMKKARFYNIFPDSFAKSSLNKDKKINLDGIEYKNKIGGTIKDISSKLKYIKDMGFNGLYLNPIFKAGEYHKYDTVDYFKVDPLFGTNDEFKRLVKKAHELDIKVVVDLVLNHSGWYFFAFDDVIKNQEKSKYKDWFYDLKFPVYRPKTREEIPPYACFGYERNMPKLNTDNEEVINYFKDLCLYLIKEFEVDGFRFDTSDEVNDYFWIEISRTIKKENKDVVLIGEVWENPNHWLNSLMFDSAMNYELRREIILLFNETISGETFKNHLVKLLLRTKKQYNYTLLDILSTHDTPRLFSLLKENKFYYRSAYMLLYFLPGAKSVLYGEECPIKGIKEDDYRQHINFRKKARFAEFFKKLNTILDETNLADSEDISVTFNKGLLKVTCIMKDKVYEYLLATKEGVSLSINGKILLENGFKKDVNKLRKFGSLIIEGYGNNN